MSVAAIAAAVVDVVEAVSGVQNVYEEEPTALDRALAREQRIDADGRLHFWHVHLSELPPAGGIGYVELRHRVTVEGFIGVSRDAPANGVKSDVLARRLLSAVTYALAKPANIGLAGTALGSQDVTPEPLRIVKVNLDGEVHPAHRLAVTYTVSEDAT